MPVTQPSDLVLGACITVAIQMGGTMIDLEEAELCYAPQFGAAKDPVNLAGMIGANVLRGETTLASWDDVLSGSTDVLILDVRLPDEYQQQHIPTAVNIPLENLRGRLEELPRDRKIATVCVVGQRAYNAMRLLKEHGFDASLLSGGMLTYQCITGRITDWNKS